MTATDNIRILYLSEIVEGIEHDKALVLESEIKINKEIKALVD